MERREDARALEPTAAVRASGARELAAVAATVVRVEQAAVAAAAVVARHLRFLCLVHPLVHTKPRSTGLMSLWSEFLALQDAAVFRLAPQPVKTVQLDNRRAFWWCLRSRPF